MVDGKLFPKGVVLPVLSWQKTVLLHAVTSQNLFLDLEEDQMTEQWEQFKDKHP